MDGAPLPSEWYLRLVESGTDSPPKEPTEVTSWLKTQTGGVVDPTSVTELLRCCVCMRGPPHSKVAPHHGGECGLVASLSKMRAHAGLRPLHVQVGSVDASAKKKQVTLESLNDAVHKSFKDVSACLAQLEKRLTAVELGGKPKRKGAPSTASTQSAGAKKAKKANSTDGQKAAGATTSQSTAKKGKGKAKGKPAQGRAAGAAAGGKST